MKSLTKILAGAAAAAGVVFLSSCGSTPSTTSNSPGTAFSFDPPVTQPTNRSAVKIAISTSAQKMYIVEGDKVLLASPVAVGKASSPTPKGTHRITSKTKHRRRQSQPGAGYPMTYWMSFYSPAYGMHWGFVKPYPCTAGCVRMPLNTARKAFDIVSVGTPVNVSSTQPWDTTVGAKLPRLDDSPLPNPPMSYMKSSKVFTDADQGKMWTF
ncbi:L,D-transpeptidase [Roseibacillus persicicus]|uniref:L,D-transpeptidase n=1 Tax=Roseibacillus persicicus TaxID=454148 RepID=UPI00280FE9CE|nr:L,D-transpeptidase [Roseibacillus persicicus]MDQ8190549.1 L,D-transpeptidase [Roseibacillus persicicus]